MYSNEPRAEKEQQEPQLPQFFTAIAPAVFSTQLRETEGSGEGSGVGSGVGVGDGDGEGEGEGEGEGDGQNQVQS